jgi:hypothetical protein
MRAKEAPGVPGPHGGRWPSACVSTSFMTEISSVHRQGSPARDRRVAIPSSALVAVLLALVACNEPSGPAPDAGAACTTPAPPFGCVTGAAGGCCDKSGVSAVCRDGQWTCPRGTVAFEACCGYGSTCAPYPGPLPAHCAGFFDARAADAQHAAVDGGSDAAACSGAPPAAHS